MKDVGIWLVLAFAFYGPWLARRLDAPKTISWPIFFAAVALLALSFFDYVHVYLPKIVGNVVTAAVMLAIIARLAFDLSEPADKSVTK